MKINRSGPAGPTGPTDQPPEVDKTGGKDFAQKLDRPAGPAGAAATGGATGQGPVGGVGPTGSSLVADIAADLKAGKITPEVAVDRAMERVLDSHVGAGSDAPAGLRTKVEAALKEAVANDPVLLAKIERLRS